MTKHSLFPVPKVLIPFALAVVAIVVKWIATGELNREEIGAAVGIGLYAVLGWSTPPTYDQVKAQAKKVIPGKARRKR